MKSLATLLAATFILLSTSVPSPAKPQPKPFEFDGTLTAISQTGITVKGASNTRTFAIYPGTVFGQRAKATFTDFKVGEHVIVVFSEEAGKAKAENIRDPANDKVKGAKKKKAQ